MERLSGAGRKLARYLLHCWFAHILHGAVLDPADPVARRGWLFAVIFLVAGSVVTVIANAIAAIRRRSAAAK